MYDIKILRIFDNILKKKNIKSIKILKRKTNFNIRITNYVYRRIKIGLESIYNSDLILIRTKEFKNGKKHGKQIKYFKNGLKKKSTIYKNAKKDGLQYFCELTDKDTLDPRIIVHEIFWYNGYKHGIEAILSNDKITRIIWINGFDVGLTKTFDKQ